MNVILGIPALLDVLRNHVIHKEKYLDSQLRIYSQTQKDECAKSKLWSQYEELVKHANDWYGMDSSFEGLSFNPLSVENELEWAVNQKNSVINTSTEWHIGMKNAESRIYQRRHCIRV